MFRLTGVTQPKLDVGNLNERKGHYETLSSAANDSATTTFDAKQAVLGANSGPGTTSFGTRAEDLKRHLSEVRAAATRTATAYGDAATKGGDAQTAMVALAKDREAEYWRRFWRADLDGAQRIVDTTRGDLQRMETRGGNDVRTAFSRLDLPAALPLGRDEGDLDHRIVEDWKTMSDDDRKAFLQKMADKYADDNGFPRQKIDWKKPDGGALGVYKDRHYLRVDPDNLSDPDVMNTVIHEMQHRRQYTGYNRFRWWWQDNKNGMSREEAERWKRLNSDDVRNKGDDPSTEENEGYWPRPVEVDARAASARYINEMSYDDYRRMRDPSYEPAPDNGTPTATFNPPVWKAEGEKINSSADDFYRRAEPVVIMMAFRTHSNSPIEAAASEGDGKCLVPWHRLVAGAKEGMTSLGSRMVGTGTDYAATEEANREAAERFWR